MVYESGDTIIVVHNKLKTERKLLIRYIKGIWTYYRCTKSGRCGAFKTESFLKRHSITVERGLL